MPKEENKSNGDLQRMPWTALSWRIIVPLIAAVFGLASIASAKDGRKPVFNRDIRPILSDTCFKCHGPDKAARKADLRLDERETAIKAEAIVPGNPDESLVVERIFSDDPTQVMPPPNSGKSLTG